MTDSPTHDDEDLLAVRNAVMGRIADVAEARSAGLRFVRPIAESADSLIDEYAARDDRFLFGIPSIDQMIRGISRGQMCIVSGKPHNGKSQLVLQAVANNKTKRVLWITPDESAELVLAKLTAIEYGVDVSALEARVRRNDMIALDMIRTTAIRRYSNLLVVDEALTVAQIEEAIIEAESYFNGEKLDLVVVDFLDLVLAANAESEGPDTRGKAKALKNALKRADTPGIIITQNSRGSSPPGKPAGMTGMAYGGETEAIYVIEVYRKMFDADLDEFARRKHASTVTANICKNKRPPCMKGEIDLAIDPMNGRINELNPMALRPLRTVDELHTVV